MSSKNENVDCVDNLNNNYSLERKTEKMCIADSTMISDVGTKAILDFWTDFDSSLQQKKDETRKKKNTLSTVDIIDQLNGDDIMKRAEKGLESLKRSFLELKRKQEKSDEFYQDKQFNYFISDEYKYKIADLLGENLKKHSEILGPIHTTEIRNSVDFIIK